MLDENNLTVTSDVTEWKNKDIASATRNKELIHGYKVIAFNNGEFEEIIDCRLLMGRSQSSATIYCNLWIHARKPELWLHTSGSAGGYGYHKQSAALADALRSASIDLSRSINGVGETAMRAALIAIANKLGYMQVHVSESYA